jgi:two-component system response regulator AtoC
MGVSGSSATPTIFLDEVAELNSNCQARLLHYLPNGDAIQNAGVLHGRVISATCHDIDEEVRAGRFRKELYYRLKGVSMRLPPLRERKEDIPSLVDIFLTKHSGLLGLPRPAVSPRTLRLLQDYSWPGNIRELENVVKKIVAVADESAALSDLDSTGALGQAGMHPAERISLKEAGRAASRQAERELIQRVLTRVRWNRKRAAQELQISYKALLYKLKQMGLDGSNA